MSRLISLAERRDAPVREEVVSALETALDEATQGKIQALVLIKVDRLGDFQHVMVGDYRITQVIGLIEVAKHDLLEAERRQGAPDPLPEDGA